MSTFQFKFNTSRAEDIIEGVDPVVHAGAVAIRGITLPLTSSNSSNNDTSSSSSSKSSTTQQQKAFLSIREEKVIESQFHQQSKVQEFSDLKSPFDNNNTAENNNKFVAEALSRGFTIRRQRMNDQNDESSLTEEQKQQPEPANSAATKKKTSTKPKKNNNNSTKMIEEETKKQEQEIQQQQKVKIPARLEYHLLLTPQELQRLQTSMTNYHQTTTRTDSKSLFEKFTERLAVQRANFVNGMIESERLAKRKKKEQQQQDEEKEQQQKVEAK